MEDELKSIEEIIEISDVDDYSSSEKSDSRISELINEAVGVIIDEGSPQDISIDFEKLLNLTFDTSTEEGLKNKKAIEELKPVNIKRRKVNGTKFFSFLKDFKVLLSFMKEEEYKQLLSLRVMFMNYAKLTKTQISSMSDAAIHTFVPFINDFMQHVDPVAYTPKCKNMEDKALQELYFSEEHLIYLIKLIILSKITLVFTDCAPKELRAEAKKELSRKIWNTAFIETDKKIDMKNKIHKLISSRFVSTIYNEKRFWAAAQFANITITTQSNLLYNELKTDSILMLEFDKNPLSFLDVFLKNTIFYLSRRKFPLEFILSNFDSQTSVMNSEISTEYKVNILDEAIMTNTVDNFIKQRVNPLISDGKMLNEFKSNFKKNILHFWIVVPYISRLLSVSPMFLCSLHKDKFIKLIIFVYFRLIKYKCLNMAELVKSNIIVNNTGAYNDNIKNAASYLSKCLKNEEFKSLIESEEINDNITDITKLLINPLIAMLANTFEDFNGNKIEISNSELISEYSRFMTNYLKLK